MSVDANALERETLERKDREELQKIVAALGGKATSRTRKADLIDQILELTGVTAAPAPAEEARDTGAEPEPAGTEAPAPASEVDGEPAVEAAGGDRQGPGAAPVRGERGRGQQGQGEQGRAEQGRGQQGQGEQDRNERGQEERGRGDQAQDERGRGERDRGEPSPGRGQQAPGRGERPEGGAQAGSGDGQDGSEAKDEGAGRDDGADEGDDGGKRRRRRGRNRDAGPSPEEYSGEPVPVAGVLDLRDDGYGFLRVDGLLPSKDDCYVSVKQVRQFGLRKGDVVAGGSRPAFRNEKNPAILHIDTVNDVALEPGTERALFEELTAVFPTERIALTLADEPGDRTARALDLVAPFGKGSRVLVLAPPRTGATTVLQTVARSVEVNEPDAALVVVLLDERPEEVTEMQRLVGAGTVYGSAFDRPADEHVAVLELAMARAQRMAEAGDDVVVVVDGLTRLARAAHAASPGVGRSLGGLDVSAVQAAKRCFGTGRKLEQGGSVTVVATARVDTRSAVDEAVVDAVLGGATTVVRLDRFAAERRAFPAIDVAASGTRHEEMLVGADGAEARDALRRRLAGLPADGPNGHSDPLDGLLDLLRSTASNDELLESDR